MDYYTNSGSKWTSEEEQKIIREYNDQNLDINEIGLVHRRTPGGISSKLAILGIIPDRHSGRGYDKYIKTDLYKEICENTSEKKKQISEKRKEKLEKNKRESSFICIKECDYLELKEELSDVKEELKEIKNMIKRLAIYEFDD